MSGTTATTIAGIRTRPCESCYHGLVPLDGVTVEELQAALRDEGRTALARRREQQAGQPDTPAP